MMENQCDRHGCSELLCGCCVGVLATKPQFTERQLVELYNILESTLMEELENAKVDMNRVKRIRTLIRRVLE